MKKILSLCINLVIFIISDAFAVKLIAGNRSVVKKDGVTHTISKYYVVPNDFDPNNGTRTNSNITEASQTTKLRLNHSMYSTSLHSGIKKDQVSGVKLANQHNTNSNTTAASQITKLRLNHSIYSKSKASRIKNEDQVSGVKLANKHNNHSNTTEASQITKLRLHHRFYSKSLGSAIKNEDQDGGVKLANKQNKNNNIAVENIEVSVGLDQNDIQDKVSNQTYDKIAEATESVTTEHSTKPDALINLLVEPITYHINISSDATTDHYRTGNVLQNESRRIVQIATETDFDAELDNLILSKFGLEVHKSSTKNIDSFWKLVKLNMNSTLDNEEFMAKLDRLTRLLNIFTNLYDAVKSQKPYESMIDGIIDILQIPFVEKRNTFESQSDEECLRKCGRNRSTAQVVAKGTEPEGQKPSSNLELENLLLKSGLTGDSDNEYALINPNNYQKSNEVIESTEPTNSQLLKPYKLNIGKPDGYNVRLSKPRPKLNHVARDNDNIQGDPKSNQTLPDSTETDNYLDDQPSTTESSVTEPWIIAVKPTTTRKTKSRFNEDKSSESRSSDDQPRTTESSVTKPWITEEKPTATRGTKPWISEDKSSESRSSDDQPMTIESRVTKPWMIEDKPTETRATKPWIIEDKPTTTRVTKPWIIEDKSTENAATDDQPRTTESRVTKPWINEDKSPKNLPSTIQTLRTDSQYTTTKNLPWNIEYKTNENLSRVNKSINRLPWTIKHRTKTIPWIIEDRKQLPWIIEDRNQLPWIIEDRKQLPWIIEDRKQLPWTIEDRKQLPWIIEDRNQLPWIIEDRKQLPWIIEDRKQLPWIIEDRKHPAIAHRIKNVFKKPYHIYTYVINPTTSEHEIPNSGKIVDMKSRQPNSGYTYSPSYYASQDILPKTTIDSQPSNSQLKHTKYMTTTYDTRTTLKPATHFFENPYDVNQPIFLDGPGVKTNNKPTLLQPTNQPDTSQLKLVTPSYDTSTVVNPSTYFTDTPHKDNQPKYLVGSGIETNNKPTLLQPTNQPDTSQLKLANPSYDTSTVVNPSTYFTNTPHEHHQPKYLVGYGIETNNKPILLQTTNEPGPSQLKLVSPTYDAGKDVNPSDLLSDTSQDDYQPDYSLGPGIETNDKPELLQPSQTHKNSDKDNDEPQVPQEESSQPGFPKELFNPFQTLLISDKFGPLSTASGENPDLVNTDPKSNKPNLIEPTNVHPASIYKVSSYSDYNLPNDYDEPNYGGKTNKQPGLISTASSSTTYTNSPNDHDKPNYIRPANQRPGFISSSASSSAGYPNVGYYYDKPSPIYDVNTTQHPGYISKASSHSEFTTPNNNNNPTADSSEDLYQQTGSVPKVAYHPEYTNDYNEPTSIYGANTPQLPAYISKASLIIPNDSNNPKSVSSEDIDQQLDYIPIGPYHPEYTNVPDNNNEQIPVNSDHTAGLYHGTPVYGADLQQHPGYKSMISTHSEYKNVPNDYNYPTANSNEDIDQRPGSVPKVPQDPEYIKEVDHYDKTPIYSENTSQRPGYISKVSTHSEYTNGPNNYNYPTVYSSEDLYQRPGYVPKVPQYPEYTKVIADYDKPNRIYSANIPQRPGYISTSSLIIPNDYNNPTADSSEDINPGFVPEVPHHPEFISLHENYNEPAPIYSANIPQRPPPSGHISKASAHSEYIYAPNGYIDDDKDTDRPSLTQNVPHYPVDSLKYNVDPTLFNNGPTGNKDISPLNYNPHGQHATQSSLIENLLVSEPTEPNHIENFKLKMAPTYRLFTLDNLLKLHDAVIKVIEMSGADVSDTRALINLRQIIKIILILAKQLEKPEGSNEWYIKIFYNVLTHRRPLQLYVHNLLRQRWLHELMLLLVKNNFDIQILQNPKIFSFLGSWQFPDDVQNFLKAEDLIHHDFDAPVDYGATLTSQKHKFSTHTYDNLLEIPKELANYVTDKVMQNYEPPNDGIVLSIAGVKAEPDANAIINILQKYLHYKSEIENQENVIIRDNKVEMLKQIILFLKQKGYDASTIANLIHKLYSAIYLSEVKDCQPHHPKFEKNIFNVILPVLRRSGR